LRNRQEKKTYFTGADEPYGKPTLALRSEIDEAARATLHFTQGRPFVIPDERDKPK
jgi:hypothetical protein